MMRRNTKKNKKRSGKRTALMVVPRPPPMRSNGIIHEHRMRFVANAAFNSNVTFQNLLDTVLFAASSVTGYDVFEAVRVNFVECWCTPDNGVSTVTLVYTGFTVGAAGDQRVHTDTSSGIEPAYVKGRPDPLTQAGLFQASTGAVAFSLQCPVNTVIDVHVTLRQAVLGSFVAAQNSLSAATTGVTYYRGLDGKATAATVLPPVGVFAVQ